MYTMGDERSFRVKRTQNRRKRPIPGPLYGRRGTGGPAPQTADRHRGTDGVTRTAQLHRQQTDAHKNDRPHNAAR